MPPHIRLLYDRHVASEARREAAQGKGRPILSIEKSGARAVFVANQVLSGQWRTFEDFLLDYLRRCFGPEWGRIEERKPHAEQHIVFRWWSMFMKQLSSSPSQAGKVRVIPRTGVSAALLALAYNLYLLAHNADLQDRLVRRLKHPDQFNGAYYETLVAAWFIVAGFKLTLLDEITGKVRSCEFEAQAPSGKVFSVEAKARQPGKTHIDIGNQLVNALKKHARHERMVFIDLNSPHSPSVELGAEVVQTIRSRETALTIDGKPAPPAYVFVTNHPYHYNLDGVGNARFLVAEGFKIPDFGSVTFHRLVDQFKAEQRHRDVLLVFEAFRTYNIPSTFDGELPEVAFGSVARRWLIGEVYDLARLGQTGTGHLVSATVAEQTGLAHLAFALHDGQVRVLSDRLTDEELGAYRKHPESFFGVRIQQASNADTPLALFRFFHESYQRTPRSKLLEFFVAAGARDLAVLSELPDDDLLLEYCDRHVMAAMHSGWFQSKKG